MRVLIYGLNFSPELTGIGKYTGDMSRYLQCNNDLSIVTTPPYYPEWKVRKGYSKLRYSAEKWEGTTVVRCPFYIPRNPTTIKRLLHLFSHALSSFPVVLWLSVTRRPEVVITVQPTMFAAPFGLLAARLSGAKAVMHIQDFEIDAMLGLGMLGEGVFPKLAHGVESWLMRRFDRVSTISYSMMQNAKLKGVSSEKLRFFPNWADTEFVTPDVNGHALRKEWGYNKQDIIILYAGNMGKKQGLEIVLDAAEALKDEVNVKFLLVGTGANADVLRLEAKSRELGNVHFKPLQAWGIVPQMLAMADIHLVVQKKGAADVVLPSKLTNILSAGGHALVTADVHTELGRLSERFPGIYQRVEPEDSESFTQSLKKMLHIDFTGYNKVARNYALEYLSKERVLSRFEQDLADLCGQTV